MTNQIPNKIYLSDDEMPAQYYNLRSDMKIKPAPLLNPATLQPVSGALLCPWPAPTSALIAKFLW